MDLDALFFRPAERADLPAIVAMLADDPLGAQREQPEEPLLANYYAGFEAIAADPNNELLVAEMAGQVVAVLQLTFLPNISYQGSWRAQIEGVRVLASLRGQGIGRALLAEAIRKAEARDCHMVQLTSSPSRLAARRFYERLGFEVSHLGLTLPLPWRPPDQE